MPPRRILYLLAAVFVGSVIIAYAANAGSILREIARYPAIAALFVALWQTLSWELSEQRDTRLEQTKTLNTLFAGTHYASRLYDRHLEFCECYWSRVLDIVKEMEKEGESDALIGKANELYTYRLEQAIWLTEEMSVGLEGFEKALRGLGTEYFRMTHLPVGERRTQAVNTVSRRFEQIMNYTEGVPESTREVPSYLDVLELLQEILGISEASSWRADYMKSAEES